MTADSYTNWNIAAFWYRDQAQSLAQTISNFLISRQAWEFTAIDYIYFPYICTHNTVFSMYLLNLHWTSQTEKYNFETNVFFRIMWSRQYACIPVFIFTGESVRSSLPTICKAWQTVYPCSYRFVESNLWNVSFIIISRHDNNRQKGCHAMTFYKNSMRYKLGKGYLQKSSTLCVFCDHSY